MRSPLMAFCLAMIISAANAEDYFGRFDGSITGDFVVMPGQPRNLFVLKNDFKFIDPNGLEWIVPKGEVTDGASIPSVAWSLVGASFSGPHLNAAVVHDYFTCTRHRNWDDTQTTFWRGLKVMGVSDLDAQLMYWAVYLFGPDRWPTPQNPHPPAPCRSMTDDGRIVHNNYQFAMDQRRFGISKITAMARTYQTTKGRAMDVVQGTVIPSEGEAAKKHLETLYSAVRFPSKFSISELGLFSTVTSADVGKISDVSGWEPGQIAALDEFMQRNSIRYVVSDNEGPVPLVKSPYEPDVNFPSKLTNSGSGGAW